MLAKVPGYKQQNPFQLVNQNTILRLGTLVYACKRLRGEGFKFKASLDYIGRPCLKAEEGGGESRGGG